MHQSIPAVLMPSPGNRRAFAHIVSPGDGAFAILSRLVGLATSVPRGDPWAFFERWSVRAAKSGKLFLRAETTELRN